MTLSLSDLGWSNFFDRQRDDDTAAGLTPYRIAEIHRDRLTGFAPGGDHSLTTPPDTPTGSFAVGDWVLADDTHRVVQLLERQTLLTRRAAGHDARVQLIAANVDTLFITTSCNADFNPARIERYLAMAQDAGCFPVLLLTKPDLTDDAAEFERRAQAVNAMVPVLIVNAKDADDLARIADWCKPGQTAALIGSSGVGKSTIMNGLTGEDIATQAVREDDAKGRHTTTFRALRRMRNGGWLIDMPGMRELQLHDAAEGIDSLFDDITALESDCRFADCAHDREPGCAVRAAVASGQLDPARLERWNKLRREDAHNSATLAQARARDKGFTKMIKSVVRDQKGRKGR